MHDKQRTEKIGHRAATDTRYWLSCGAEMDRHKRHGRHIAGLQMDGHTFFAHREKDGTICASLEQLTLFETQKEAEDALRELEATVFRMRREIEQLALLAFTEGLSKQ